VIEKFRGKAIDDVIKFSFVKHDGKKELAQNTNTIEVEICNFRNLKKLKEIDSNQKCWNYYPSHKSAKIAC